MSKHDGHGDAGSIPERAPGVLQFTQYKREALIEPPASELAVVEDYKSCFDQGKISVFSTGGN